MKRFLACMALASVAAVLGTVDAHAQKPAGPAAVRPQPQPPLTPGVGVKNDLLIRRTNQVGSVPFLGVLDDDWCWTKPRIIRRPPPPPPPVPFRDSLGQQRMR